MERETETVTPLSNRYLQAGLAVPLRRRPTAEHGGGQGGDFLALKKNCSFRHYRFSIAISSQSNVQGSERATA